jgi:septal ring factor EnvC (AmiA/AmiB activator)
MRKDTAPISLRPQSADACGAHALAGIVALVCAALLFTAPAPAAAQQDKNADKAARRLQQQMRGLQQQVDEAQAAKAKVEADKAALDKELKEQSEQAGKLSGSLRKTNDSLRATEKARADLAAQVAALEKQLADQKRTTDEALAVKEAATAQLVKARDAEQAQLQGRYDEQVKLVGECSAKNDRLLRLSAELVDRYRGKSVADVLKQRDPVFGIGDVQMFNLVQEYRDKADAERFSPSSAPSINR